LGLNVETKDYHGKTFLHYLCQQYWSGFFDNAGVELAKILTERGAKIDDENEDGEIPFGLVRVNHSKSSTFFQWLREETKSVFGDKW
jgi:hypothetical protein